MSTKRLTLYALSTILQKPGNRDGMKEHIILLKCLKYHCMENNFNNLSGTISQN